MSFATIFSLVCAFQCIIASRILFLSTNPQDNDLFIVMETILRNSGHDITTITYNCDQRNFNNSEHTHCLRDSTNDFTKLIAKQESAAFSYGTHESEDALGSGNFLETLAQRCNNLMTDEEISRIILDLDADLMVIGLLGTDICGLVLSRRFNVPVVGVLPTGLQEPFSYLSNNPYQVSVLAASSVLSHATPSFGDRFRNLLVYVANMKLWHGWYYSKLKSDSDMVHLYTRLSFIFVNSDIILDQARPMYPNIIQIGGIHFHPPRKIPEDLEKSVLGARVGIVVVFFKMSLAFTDLPLAIQKTLLTAFSSIPHKVVLCNKVEIMEDFPKNVISAGEADDQDLIGHPRARLLISLCDRMMVLSAVYHSIPMVCLPLVGEQFTLAHQVQQKGLGVSIPFNKVTQDVLVENIFNIQRNRSFLENARVWSSLARDRSETPDDRFQFWTEYTLRHKGTQLHSSCPSNNNLNFVQYFLLDVVLLAALIAALCFGVVAALVYAAFKLYSTQTALKPKSD